jgi:NhaP-type Na+/H+ or K+/H+ antiporter
MTTAEAGALTPELAFALVGALGVGSQWLAWRLQLPAIVLMLVAGLAIGPATGILVPERDIGPLLQPMIAIAVAIILFEGGLTLNLHGLGDAKRGVLRLVLVGAPLGWALSAAALHYIAGLSWPVAAVFGGIMIVTGPTVIAPLLRQARLARRPAVLLQWEAIVNDPIGALAAVLAYEAIVVAQSGLQLSEALWVLAFGIAVAGAVGVAAGYLTVIAFRRGWVPEYMKVPVLFVLVLAAFVGTNMLLEESGLLAVTVMGVVIANADLAAFTELRRFKEHATVLLVSGVFILLAASMDVETLSLLNWRAMAFVAAVILLVRPLTVLVSLLYSGVPRNERLLVALTGPRGVVLVAVAGLFGDKLAVLGFEDAELVAPLAFALVAVTVVLHGFTLAPLARRLGLAGAETPGLLIVGGSRFATSLAQSLAKRDIPVLITDPNWSRLRQARDAGVQTFYGDILSEAAEQRLEFVSYQLLLAASDNDAYNTLVATDLGPEFGREKVWQLPRANDQANGGSRRHSLPATLGGRRLASGLSFTEIDRRMGKGWQVRTTVLRDEFTLADWRAANPEGVLLGWMGPRATLRLVQDTDELQIDPGARVLALVPPDTEAKAKAETAGQDGRSPRAEAAGKLP